jgi:hypothetical protein
MFLDKLLSPRKFVAAAHWGHYCRSDCLFGVGRAEARSLNREVKLGHRKRIMGVRRIEHLKKLEDKVSTWPQVSVHPHRFGDREFRFGSAEIGHVHAGGMVDIPFPRSFAMRSWRTVLLRSIVGFRTQVGSHFKCAMKKTSAMPSGLCGCHISVTF